MCRVPVSDGRGRGGGRQGMSSRAQQFKMVLSRLSPALESHPLQVLHLGRSYFSTAACQLLVARGKAFCVCSEAFCGGNVGGNLALASEDKTLDKFNTLNLPPPLLSLQVSPLLLCQPLSLHSSAVLCVRAFPCLLAYFSLALTHTHSHTKFPLIFSHPDNPSSLILPVPSYSYLQRVHPFTYPTSAGFSWSPSILPLRAKHSPSFIYLLCTYVSIIFLPHSFLQTTQSNTHHSPFTSFSQQPCEVY